MMKTLWLTWLLCASCQHRPPPQSSEFVDMTGRQVRIKTPARRVVTAGAIPAINSIFALLGQQQAIQNGLPKQLHSARWAFLRTVMPGVAERPVVSSMGPDWAPDYEALGGLSYDVVVLDSLATATSMEKRGIPAVVVRWSGVQSVNAVVRSLGDLMGEKARARAYIDYADAILARIKTRLAAEQERHSVLYVRLSNFTMPIIGNSHDLVELGGGRYVVDPTQVADHAAFSHEQLINWDPEFLWVWSPSEVTELSRDPRYSQLRAVKDHHVYAIPMGLHLWLHYTTEIPLGALWVAHVLHPDLILESELEQEVTSFYSQFYGYALQPSELQAILSGQP